MALLSGLSALTLFGGAMVLLGGVVFVVSARYVWRTTAVLRATEIDNLGTVDAGMLVRVSGHAAHRDDESLIAPFSAAECIVLQYSIEERRLSVLYFPWYATVHETMGAIAFDVQTANGTVPVGEPARTVTLAKHIVETVPPDRDPADRIAQFKQQVDAVPPSNGWRDPPSILVPLFRVLAIGTRRYSERRVALGDDVTVVGRVDTDGSGIDPLVVSDRSPVGTLFRMAKISLVGLLIGLFALPFGVLVILAG